MTAENRDAHTTGRTQTARDWDDDGLRSARTGTVPSQSGLVWDRLRPTSRRRLMRTAMRLGLGAVAGVSLRRPAALRDAAGRGGRAGSRIRIAGLAVRLA